MTSKSHALTDTAALAVEQKNGMSGFLHRDWRVERAAWALFALAIAAALLGGFGNGLLSAATTRARDLRVEYHRFVHRQSPTTLVLHVGAAPAAQPTAAPPLAAQTIVVWIDRTYVEAMHIERIVPEPREMRMDDDRLLCEFSAPASGSLHITLHLEPQCMGNVRARLGVKGDSAGESVDDARVEFGQFVYP